MSDEEKVLKASVSKEFKLKFAYACLKYGTNATAAMRTMALALVDDDKRAIAMLRDYDSNKAA